MKGTLPGFGDVWHDPKAITNIVSFGNAEKYIWEEEFSKKNFFDLGKQKS